MLERTTDLDLSYLSYDSGGYPPDLRHIHDPPAILFCRGERSILTKPCVSIVGARNCDRYGRSVAMALGRELAQAGNVVVSGLALGIDGNAHRGALEGLKTISRGATCAVLAHGLDRVYPTQHEGLAREIVESGGLLISHFELGCPPLPHQFLDRNRVIAGLALATVVVQAAKRSGSLATARFAMESGREVLVVPGPIDNFRSEGCNRLIQQGAYPLSRVEDVFDLVSDLYRAGNPLEAARPQLSRQAGTHSRSDQ